MSDAVMTIRQMCETYDVTARTLRFYEAKELLHPIREGQKRLFTLRDRARLTLILRGKRFGLSLEQIRQLLDLYSKNDRQHAQLTRTSEVGRERLGELRLEREELDAAISDLEDQLSHIDLMLGEIKRDDAA